MRCMAPILFAATLGLLIGVPAFSKNKPIPVKVVVITMFERGADTGDEPGELQYWVERNHLDRVIPFPQGFHHLRMNRDGVLAVLTRVRHAQAAAALIALGMDPRFAPAKAHRLAARTAGVNPALGLLRTAAARGWAACRQRPPA